MPRGSLLFAVRYKLRTNSRLRSLFTKISAFSRQENASPSTPSTRRVPARQRSGDPHSRADYTQATWVGLASSGFILLPAGRDVVAMETPILPGDEELIAAMTMANPDARRWFWGMWGLNHCFLSILKLQAINQKDKAMLKKLFIPTAATFLYCVLGCV